MVRIPRSHYVITTVVAGVRFPVMEFFSFGFVHIELLYGKYISWISTSSYILNFQLITFGLLQEHPSRAGAPSSVVLFIRCGSFEIMLLLDGGAHLEKVHQGDHNESVLPANLMESTIAARLDKPVVLLVK